MATDIKAKHFKLIGASTTHIAAAQTLGGAGNFTLANTTVGNLPQTITFTSSGNISGVEMTITGTDLNGDAQTEAINGPNSNTVTLVTPSPTFKYAPLSNTTPSSGMYGSMKSS